jgi:hypothetical protein
MMRKLGAPLAERSRSVRRWRPSPQRAARRASPAPVPSQIAVRGLGRWTVSLLTTEVTSVALRWRLNSRYLEASPCMGP